jgi:hypothetical protein
MYLYTSFQTRFIVLLTNCSYQLYARVGDIVNLPAMTVGALLGSRGFGDKNLLVLWDERSTMLRGGRGSRYIDCRIHTSALHHLQ